MGHPLLRMLMDLNQERLSVESIAAFSVAWKDINFSSDLAVFAPLLGLIWSSPARCTRMPHILRRYTDVLGERSRN